MQGCKRGCLVQLAVWIAFAAAFYFHSRSPLSILAGLLAAMGCILLAGVVRTIREHAMLNGEPRDGAWVAVCGEIRTRTPLRAPFSNVDVAGYHYTIQRWVQRSLRQVYDGKAIASPVITTRYGAVKLLAVPLFEMDVEALEKEKALRNANAYIRATTFASRDTASQRTETLEAEWNDDDGVFRVDKKYGDAVLDEKDRFEERLIRQGDRVCAFGVYSKERGGIVPDQKWGRHPRIIRGSAEEIAARLRGRMIRYTIGAIVLIGAALAVALLVPPAGG